MKKMRFKITFTFIIGFFLFSQSLSAQNQEEIFTVIAKAGRIISKEYPFILTGMILHSKDQIRLSENSMIVLLHQKGTIQIREEGLYSIHELAASLEKSTIVTSNGLKKLLIGDVIEKNSKQVLKIKETKDYQNITGDIASDHFNEIECQLPKRANILKKNYVIKIFAKKDFKELTVKLSNVFDEKITSFTIKKDTFHIDFSQPILIKEDLISIKLEAKDFYPSMDYGFTYLTQDETTEFEKNYQSFKTSIPRNLNPVYALVKEGFFLEKQKLSLDAWVVFQQVLSLSDDDALQIAFRQFLKRNDMMTYIEELQLERRGLKK